MRDVFKIASILLRYPDERLLGTGEEIGLAIEDIADPRPRQPLESFFGWWNSQSPRELAELYVSTFDLRRRASLYLTFYTYGDTRKRGMALLRLKKLYRAAGFPWDSPELPDYLPAMLEFAAIAPDGHGAQVLGQHRTELEALRLALRDSASPYALLLDVVGEALGEVDESQQHKLSELIRNGPPQEQVGLEPFAPPEVMPIGVRR